MSEVKSLRLNESEYESVTKEVSKRHSTFQDNFFFNRLLTTLKSENINSVDTMLAIKDFLVSIQRTTDQNYSSFAFPRELRGQELEVAKKTGLIQRQGTNLLQLDQDSLHEHDLDVYTLQNKRKTEPVQLDACLKIKLDGLGYNNYQTAGQRLAVRTCLTAKKGSTIFVNLPTGCGKTLISHASILFQRALANTIVILPTVGLSIEQADRAKEIIHHCGIPVVSNYCWHASLTQEEREEIKLNMQTGRQKVLFTSPESLTGSLLYLLFSLSRSDQIAEIIVDEAHLIDSWGTNFRPDFQKFGALLATLRKVSKSKFNTVLMSATFTQSNIEAINKVYGDGVSDPIIVNGNFLRPEIKSSVLKVNRHEHLCTVCKYTFLLPKPLILYTTTKSEADEVHKKLKEYGCTRVAKFDGDTKNEEKKRIIEKWKSNQYDIIVATSAFGVGMDKADVKTVLHASVPDNIDRYYQEIGRAGRNGDSAIALMIYHHEQLDIAQGVNREKIISIDLGFERWMDMFKRKQSAEGDLFESDDIYKLNTSFFRNKLGQMSDKNSEWNWLTLLFMQRAGAIKIYYEVPKLPSTSDESYEQLQFQKFWEDYSETIVIELLEPKALKKDYWETEINRYRERELTVQNDRFNVLRQYLENNSVTLCKTLSKYYSINHVPAQRACRGCRNCDGFSPTVGGAAYLDNYTSQATSTPRLQPLISNRNMCMVYYDNNDIFDWKGLLKSMLVKNIISGIQASDRFLAELQETLPIGFERFWISQEFEDESSFWPTILIAEESAKVIDVPKAREKVTYFFAERSQKESGKEYRNWYENYSSSLSISNFRNLLGQN
ncbi:protein DpdF [Rheinheimera sp. UJ63]|uniref:protein DpdF n=1 Tax=Rheinheimera sp. UJ63 TaxID=2910157 RepID=UPI001F318FB3|nr:protein DpdF [Rheinheimera sp. UJ63]MCF4010636.1 DEAD/DEAH box helicase [Rheinheimera sp. UJ63]